MGRRGLDPAGVPGVRTAELACKIVVLPGGYDFPFMMEKPAVGA
ncbi:MAG: hypothetical protein ACRYHQ_26890 [Janthinobacterium lividum]